MGLVCFAEKIKFIDNLKKCRKRLREETTDFFSLFFLKQRRGYRIGQYQDEHILKKKTKRALMPRKVKKRSLHRKTGLMIASLIKS